MTLLLLLAMAYEMVGPALMGPDGYELGPILHEGIGGAFLLLVLLHLWLNRRWLMNLFHGRYTAPRALLTLADLLLIVDVLLLLLSGVVMSRALGLELEGGMDLARTTHMLAAYWGFVVMSFHIGLHWRRLPLWMPLPMLYGAWAFIKRQIGDYMFLRSQFVFFDFEEPIGWFFLDYIAVMLLFAGLGCGLILLCRRA